MDRWNIVTTLNYLKFDKELEIILAKSKNFNNKEGKEIVSNMIKVADLTRKGFVRMINESVAITQFTGRLLREGFVRIRKIARLFGRGKSVKTYKRGHSIKGADR